MTATVPQLDCFAPATGERLGAVGVATAGDVERLVAAAREAH